MTCARCQRAARRTAMLEVEGTTKPSVAEKASCDDVQDWTVSGWLLVSPHRVREDGVDRTIKCKGRVAGGTGEHCTGEGVAAGEADRGDRRGRNGFPALGLS